MPVYKKRAKIAASIFIAAAIAVPFSGFSVSADSASQPTDVSFNVGSDETQYGFNWITSAETQGTQVQVAKASEVVNGAFPSDCRTFSGSQSQTYFTEGVEDNSGAKTTAGGTYAHRVTVSDLDKNTSYVYRVGDGNAADWSTSYQFTTGSGSDSFSFLAFGDPQIGAGKSVASDEAGWQDTLNKALNKYPSTSFLLSLGDQVNNYDHRSNQDDEYAAYFSPSQLFTYPLAALEGNHDYQMGEYYGYHYNFPNQNGQYGATSFNNDGDYWFRRGDTLFMVLNANNLYTADHDEFLQKAVAANPGVKWKVAAFHQSLYSEANHVADTDVMSRRSTWPQMLDKYGIDLVLQGHDHSYTRTYQMYNGAPVSSDVASSVTNPKGTVYVTLDSASGSKYYPFKSSVPAVYSAVRWQQNEPTFTDVQVSGTNLVLTTYRTDDMSVIDTYTINKPAATPAAASPAGTAKVTPASPAPSAAQAENPHTGMSGATPIALLAVLASAAFVLVIYLPKKLKNS